MENSWYEDWSLRLKEQINKLTKRGILTREQLAENMGVSRSTLANWTSSKRKTEHLKDFDRLARHVRMHPITLLFGLDPKVIKIAQRLEQLPDYMINGLLDFLELQEQSEQSSNSPQQPERRVTDRRVKSANER